MGIYTNTEIIDALNQRYELLIKWLEDHDDSLFEQGPPKKWTTGEHIKHLVLSTEPLNQGLRMPKLLLKITFGKNNRTERSFEEVVTKYQQKLSEGGSASGRYVPKPISKTQKPRLIENLKSENKKLAVIISKWKAEDLSVCLLPHPLLGKMTVREMLFFTIHHVEHHFNALKENY